ncbi:MAG TPA: hypothetical protein VGM29_05990 [Polyangiaceae bacterium]
MTTRIATGGPSTGVSTTGTTARVTPTPARPFQQVVQASSLAVVSSAEAAVSKLPGGPILAAAVRPTATAPAAGSVTTGSIRPEGPTGLGAAVPGTSDASGSGGIEQMLSQNADQNMYFLELQERMSAESRTYSAMSNVLKTRHDTMKNAISNIR